MIKKSLAILCVVIAALVPAFAGSVTGLIQSAGGVNLSNATLTWTPTQFAVVAGSFVQTAQSVNCYTDAFGNVVGLPNPLANATAAAANSGTLTAATTYYLQFTYWVGATETAPSPEFAFFLSGGQSSINITAPVLQPSGATGYRVYASTTPGGEKLQQTVTGFGNTSITSLLSVTAVTSSNNTVCSFNFSDSLIPQARYILNIVDSSGSQVPGWPQVYYVQGSPFNLNTAPPTNGTTAIFANAIVSTPSGAATQSILGALNLNGFGITVGSVTNSGNETVGGTLGAERFRGVCDPLFYAGLDDGAKIITAFADSNCVTVDASNLTGLTTAATIVIPNNKHLILPCGVFIGGSAVNPVIDINNFNTVRGKARNCTVVSTQSGTANIIAFHNATNWSYLSDLAVRSEVARTAGAGIEVSGGHNVIDRVLVYPVFDGITFDVASASGDNVVRDTEITDGTGGAPGAGLGGAWHCGVKVGGVSSGTVSGNIFSHVTASMRTAFTDAGFCIQDGADTTVITGGSQAAANIGGSDSVAVHLETVNGGNQPALTIITGNAFEGGVTKNTIVIDSGFNTTISSNSIQSGLRGILVNGGSSIRIESNQLHLNQLEGVKVTSNSNVTIAGNDFSESSQQTNNTSSDIFFAVGTVNFVISGNKHKDFSSTGNTCKFAVEVAAGGSDFYSIKDEINNANCVSGTVSDGGTGTNKQVCYPGGPCSNGPTVGFAGDLSASRSTTSGRICFGAGTNCLDFGLSTAGKYTFTGGPVALGNVARVTTDFTDANSAALQAITGLSFSLPAVAINYTFHCSVQFSQATNVAGDQFGVASLTTAPTSLSLNTIVAQNVTAGTTLYGNLVNLTTTTPTAFVTFQPAIATTLGATWDGVVEASGSGASTLQFYVLNGTAADVIVVKKDSFCTLTPQ